MPFILFLQKRFYRIHIIIIFQQQQKFMIVIQKWEGFVGQQCAKFIIILSSWLLYHSFTDFIFIMASNTHWFIESPFPKAIGFFHPQPIRPEQQQEHEDSHWNRQIYISPQSIPHIFRPSHAFNALSPWSDNVNVAQYNKCDQIIIPGMPESEAIDKPLVYSDNESEEEIDPVTPLRDQQTCKEEVQQGELHTTGRKSQLQPISKKSRPRQKGLRRLSQRAYEIVQEMRDATYKQVAAKLVQQLNEQQFQAENKQEQNIKRRVYDALNVLIALGVLKKDGRRIVSQRTANRGKKNGHLEPEQAQALRNKLQKSIYIVEQKKRKLREAQQKYRSITRLLHRNKQGNFQIQAIIPFPFVGIFVASSAILKLQHDKDDQFYLKSSETLQPFGDIDSLKWLRKSLEKLSLENKVLSKIEIKKQEQSI